MPGRECPAQGLKACSVVQAERHQEARTAAAQRIYAGSRGGCVQLAAQLARSLSLPQEASYRAMVLLDYALIAGLPYSVVSLAYLAKAYVVYSQCLVHRVDCFGRVQGEAAVLVAACLVIASESSGPGFTGGAQLIRDMDSALQLNDGE